MFADLYDGVDPAAAAATAAVAHGAHTVREVATVLDVSPSTAYDHLRLARRAGLVDWVPFAARTLRCQVSVVASSPRST